MSLIEYRLLCTRSKVSVHKTCCLSYFDYLSKVNTYVRDFLPARTAEITLYSRPPTARVELDGACISQANVQLKCACGIHCRRTSSQSSWRPPKPYRISSKTTWRTCPTALARQGLKIRELSVANQVIWKCKEVTACSQNVYHDLFK